MIKDLLTKSVNYFQDESPQTSYFDYVKVREFFLAPEITAPSLICSTGTAILDVDPAATNISWALTPSTLFATSSGTGTTASIVKSSVTNGLGTITYSFQMPSGETFTASKDIWLVLIRVLIIQLQGQVQCLAGNMFIIQFLL